MSQNEDQADSEAQGIDNKSLFYMHYSTLVAQHYRLRKAFEVDFRRMLLHLKEARELPRSESLHTINELIDYLEVVIPELEKLRLHLHEQMGEVSVYLDEREGTVEEQFDSSPRFF